MRSMPQFSNEMEGKHNSNHIGAHITYNFCRRSAADEIYALGIARKAQPLEKLKNKYSEFKKRMLSTSSLSSIPSESSTPSSTITSSNRRTVLSTTGSSSVLHTDVFGSTTTNPPRPNGRLQVFVDDAPGSATTTDDVETTTPWPDIGTRKTRIKENTQSSSKPDGVKIKQAGKSKRIAEASGKSKSSTLAIFRDPDPAETAQTPARGSSSSGFVAFKDAPAPAATPAAFKAPAFQPFRDDIVSGFF